MDMKKLALFVISRIMSKHPQTKENTQWNKACISTGMSDFNNSKEYEDERVYICQSNHSQALYVRMKPVESKPSFSMSADGTISRLSEEKTTQGNPVIVIRGDGEISRWHGEYKFIMDHLCKLSDQLDNIRLPYYVHQVLSIYYESTFFQSKAYMNENEVYKESIHTIESQQVKVYHDDKYYFMYDLEGNFIIPGTIDNNDFETTIESDIKKYPEMMNILMNLSNVDYLWKYYENDEKYFTMLDQVCYVLSFINVIVGGKKVSLRNYFPIEI